MKIQLKRRHFLIGGGVVAGAAVFGLLGIEWADSAARSRAAKLVAGAGEASFSTWIKLASDGTTTLYTPHIDFGTGSSTALAQMMADELDADWTKVRVEQAPADYAFGNWALAKSFVTGGATLPAIFTGLENALFGMAARNAPIQITGGSSAVRATGQLGVRTVAAATRMALVAVAARRLGVDAGEFSTANGIVTHTPTGKALPYGVLAEEAAQSTLELNPVLKSRAAYKYIGQSPPRFDIPAKVDGTAQYGIDVHLPEMRVATIMAAPVRGGRLVSLDPAPALAIKGVEKVIRLDNAVVVVATGYWPALKGVRALAPKFSDGAQGGMSTASIYDQQAKLIAPAAPQANDARSITADYRAPFLHHAMMEPFAMTAHHQRGKLEVWGGLQDPLQARGLLAQFAGLGIDDVTLHTTLLGGGFGRRFPPYSQIIEQIAKLAMQLDHPVKLIWSREEDVKQGAYRPQISAHLAGSIGSNGKIAAFGSNYAQPGDAGSEIIIPYIIPTKSTTHHEHKTNQVNAYWRSVNSNPHGFFNESFIDELAQLAGQDPYHFRRAHLAQGSRYLAVLDEVAQRGNWGAPLAKGTGRGIAMVESFGSIVAQVIEASIKPDGSPQVHRVTAVVDCGTLINPRNAEAQVQGGIIMGLSSAIGEAITLTAGAVDQNSFNDYPILKMADAPQIDVHFMTSDAPPGGLGEPGLPPVAPALAGALFSATGKRIRNLPILTQANAGAV